MDEPIPKRFHGEIVRRLGHGGEATVYELSGQRVLRVFHGTPHGSGALAEFYRAVAGAKTSFALPCVLDEGEEDGLHYSIDRLIPGRPFHELLRELAGEERRRALAAYTDASFEIASLPAVRSEYGEFLRDDDSISARSWSAYLLARLDRSLDAATWLREDVDSLDTLVEGLRRRIEALPPAPKALVHGDYFPGNVLMSDGLEVAGVIDFGPLTVIGDPWLDLASAAIFLEVVRPGYTQEDVDFVRRRLVERVGATILDRMTTYQAWYAIRFSPYRDDDANLYRWCIDSLRRLVSELAR